MNGSRFDVLTKSLGASSRRSLMAGGAAALAALLGRDATDEALAKKKKKKKCKGQKCGDKCISARACCTSAKRGAWVAEGAKVGQCGLCLRGKVTKDPVDCLLIDPEGCSVCSNAFECVIAPEGTVCEKCGRCEDGFCVDQDETRQCGNSCCFGDFGDCCDGECRLTASGPWQDCGGFCCQAGKSCCGTPELPVCCDTVGEVCVENCAAVGGAPACCPAANPGCCDVSG